MITKKELLRRIENLHSIYENITNFDELYKKIMESYQDSKALINQQILEYDKKIVQNSALIDNRLNEFRSKIDLAIDETFNSSKKWLDEQRLNFEKYTQDAKEKLSELSNEIVISNESVLVSKEKEISIKFDELINKQVTTWDNKIEEITLELKSVLDKHELNLNELINSIVNKNIQQILIDDISAKASENILHSFNKSLVELKQPEVESIIDAIRSMLNKHLGVVIKDGKERRPIRPIEKHEIFHKNHDKLKTCIQANSKESPIIPMIVEFSWNRKINKCGTNL